MTLPDGGPLSSVGQKRGFKNMKRTTGPSLMGEIFKISIEKGYRHYFYGSTDETLEKLYMSFNKYESELLFKVISGRSERSSTIVTTNLSFSEWTHLFENTTMVAALVDRLTYRSHVLDMSGPVLPVADCAGRE